jgi:site-specific recombinase XerD
MLPKLFESFINYQEILNRSQNTIGAYQQNLTLFCKYFDIDISDVVNYTR